MVAVNVWTTIQIGSFNKGAAVMVSSDLLVYVKRGRLVILLTEGQAISKE